MPVGPFASTVGVGRAEPKWAALNNVTDICGHGNNFFRNPQASFCSERFLAALIVR
tara:strand:+ start:293 stop:460 length:168 start_codon:yes stop_codon:yes gene_type:complete